MKKILTVAVLAAVISSACAQDSKIAQTPVLKLPLSQGLKVHRSFEGPSGLTGWVLLRDSNEPMLVFTTADGKTLVSGAVLDENGRNLVDGYVEKYAPKADFSNFQAQLDKAHYLVQGDPAGKNIVYAFFDPTCPYCNVAYDTFKTNLKTGTQIRWIPVAFLSQRSVGLAAAILGAANPSEAMAQHEASFKSGGIAPANVTPEMKRRLDENLALFREMKFKGVPAVLYRAADGRLDATKGAPQPSDLPKILAGGNR